MTINNQHGSKDLWRYRCDDEDEYSRGFLFIEYKEIDFFMVCYHH